MSQGGYFPGTKLYYGRFHSMAHLYPYIWFIKPIFVMKISTKLVVLETFNSGFLFGIIKGNSFER